MIQSLKNWWTAHDRLANGIAGVLAAMKMMKDREDEIRASHNEHARAIEQLGAQFGLTYEQGRWVKVPVPVLEPYELKENETVTPD